MDIEQYTRKAKAAERRYLAIRRAANQQADLTASARQQVTRAAAQEYAGEVNQIRVLLSEKVNAAARAVVDKRQGIVARNLTALYAMAEKQGAAAVMLASRLVELSGPGELWALYRSGDPLMQGLIALLPALYADSQDPAAIGLKTEVEKDLTADLVEEERSLRQAQSWLAGLSDDPEENIQRKKELYGSFADTPQALDRALSGDLTPAELTEAKNDLTRLLNVVWQS